MKTLMILGSKPEPALPPASSYDDVACANASGYSALKHGLPIPVYTVMTSILAAGVGSGKQSLQVLQGLRTHTVYFLKRRKRRKTLVKKVIYHLKRLKTKNFMRMQPLYMRLRLRALRYRYERFVALREDIYDGMVRRLCDNDATILAQMHRKRPSTGLVALALGLTRYPYDRYVISGFSFELTHAYGHNPEIEERGTQVSSHAETDVLIMRYLGNKFGNIYTTEGVVHAQTGLPLLPPVGQWEVDTRRSGG